ncbi:MAG: alkylmercury lyase family protein [Dehalococcoidia bacterium]
MPIQLPRRDPLHRFVLETFADCGRSPTLDEIQVRFSLESVAEANRMVIALEQRGAIHRNPNDSTITHAYPFSNDPTPHRVLLAGGTHVYSMCAIDALGMPFMLRRDARIASECANCGSAIEVEVRDGHVLAHAPVGTAVWLGEMQDGCVAATDLCPDLNFFCSGDHLVAWRSRHPGKSGEQLTFEQAVARGRQVFEDVLYGDDDGA